jgi:rRNA maturation RNase YbeY
MSGEVNFFSEDTDFKLKNSPKYEHWITGIIEKENAKLDNINYIFCNDAYLLGINQQYLNHDYYTDIISFPLSEKPDPLSGDIFISIDMVKENALKNKVVFHEELLRVMAHGVLHFLGYNDKTEEESASMRKKEDEKISIFQTLEHL